MYSSFDIAYLLAVGSIPFITQMGAMPAHFSKRIRLISGENLIDDGVLRYYVAGG